MHASIPTSLLVFLLLAVALYPPAAHMQGRGLTTGGSNVPAGVGHYYALVIGNNNYTALPKLKTAEADARAVATLLQDTYGFETKLLLNATRQQISAALYSYRHELALEANLLIYYAGHGYNDKDAAKTYWLPVDASLDDNSNWIIADEITTATKVIPAKHVLIISDSCYSGTLTRGLRESLPRPPERERFLQRMAAGHSRTLMASGGDEPVADGGGGGHSVFAAALLRGLRQMDKSQFTAAELFNRYIVEAVAGRADQTPIYDPLRNSGHESGDFVFVKVKMGDKTVEVTVKAPPAPAAEPAAFELSYWNSIQNSTEPADFKDYLAKYPNGQFVELALRRAASLTHAAPPSPSSTPATEPSRTAGEEVMNGYNPYPRAAPVAPPSTRYLTQKRHGFYTIIVPDNWHPMSQRSGWVYAPDGAYGQVQGAFVYTRGVQIGLEEWDRHDLKRSFKAFMGKLLQAKPNLRQQGGYQRAMISGQEGLMTTVTGPSAITGEEEVGMIVAALLDNGSMFYMIAVAPRSEYRSYERTFAIILNSVKF